MLTNVILVHPPFPANERHKRVLPLGIAYCAAYLRRSLPDVSVRVVDAHAEDLSLDQTLARIAVARRPGGLTVLGVSYWTLQAPWAYALSAAALTSWPDIIIVHGGVHPTALPEEALRYAHYCVLHEGEATLGELIQELREGRGAGGVTGCAWRGERGIVVNPERPFIKDLDTLPFPEWGLLPMERYDTPLHIVGGKRVPVIGSRGCPYECVYCGSPFMWGRKLRWRTPGNVLDEMGEIIRRYGIPQFHFWDDNLMLDRGYIEGLCEGIARSGMAIRWTGLTRASHVTRNADLMPLLKRSGCIGLEIGIESANPETFREIGKNEDLEAILGVAELHKRHGMYPMFTYMAFNPGETIYGYWKQARFIDRMLEGLPVARYFQPTPLPVYIGQFCTPHIATGLSREAPRKGMVLASGWADRYHHQINFVPASVLEDVPLRINRRLDGMHLRLLNYLLQTAFWSDFNRSRTRREQGDELERFRRYAIAFYRRCRGRRSVGRIAMSLSRRFALDATESVRFAAFLSYILAQLGLIQSAREPASVEIRERRVAGIDDIPGLLMPSPGPARRLFSAMTGRGYTR
ncbi:MAG: radical SAM protein [Candidatus Aureabacteria bacterium]|nr:radical SAM protein [Candidatus Auribacterota bacterium]